MTPPASLCAIMPGYNVGPLLSQTLGALLQMQRRGEVAEVIYVDDGSTDGSAALAAELGSRVLTSGGRQLGPAAARNVGASAAQSEILWFVDADVVAHDSGPKRIGQALADPGVVATFGSYDERPPAPNFASRYKNLVHHHYHQVGKEEAETFWAGCGAVRRVNFAAVGGFNADQYPHPSIEDIDLGYRLRRQGGRIVLCPQLQGTHLKVWTWRSLVETDVRRRAVPWSRLLLSGAGPTGDLNVGRTEQVRAVLAVLIFGSALLCTTGLASWPLLAAALGIAFAANLDLLTRLARIGGWPFAAAALAVHQIYYCYSLIVFVWCWFELKVLSRPPARGGMQLSFEEE